jgi:hypothetical protein
MALLCCCCYSIFSSFSYWLPSATGARPQRKSWWGRKRWGWQGVICCVRWIRPPFPDRQCPCLVPNFSPNSTMQKRRFPVTSKCRHMYEVLNVDEI